METDAKNRPQRTPMRLNKYISSAGYCSRREADRLIGEGKVFVDGKRASRGMQVLPGQTVSVGKKVLSPKEETVALAFYKPAGIVCTAEKREKNNVIRYLNYPARVTYAGRLDKDSEGLLLMTNDGDLINGMMRAANGHEKEYKVMVNRQITDEFLKKMGAGVRIIDKEKGLDEVTRPCRIQKTGAYTFHIILTQGLNRQIRRMCEALGYKVKTLKRIRIMNIHLGSLKPGEYRKLTKEELNSLYAQLRGKQ